MATPRACAFGIGDRFDRFDRFGRLGRFGKFVIFGRLVILLGKMNDDGRERVVIVPTPTGPLGVEGEGEYFCLFPYLALLLPLIRACGCPLPVELKLFVLVLFDRP